MLIWTFASIEKTTLNFETQTYVIANFLLFGAAINTYFGTNRRKDSLAEHTHRSINKMILQIPKINRMNTFITVN